VLTWPPLTPFKGDCPGDRHSRETEKKKTKEVKKFHFCQKLEKTPETGEFIKKFEFILMKQYFSWRWLVVLASQLQWWVGAGDLFLLEVACGTGIAAPMVDKCEGFISR
jgi:hypothetical protein